MSEASVPQPYARAETTSRTQADSRARRLAWLGAIAAVATVAAVVHAIVALQLPVPWIIPDEIIYSELAKSLGSGSLPSVRGEPTWGYGILYPLLVSPVWALFDDPARAHDAAKLINAVVLGLTAFPVYFLARRYVARPSAFVVSALAVFVPSMLYTGTLLTEVALYPAFALALLGVSVALRTPTRRNQLLALAGIALACTAKPLAIVLVPAYALAIVQLGLLARRTGGGFRNHVRPYATTFGLFAAGGLLVVGGSAARGNPDAVLGVYGVVLGNIDLSSGAVWFVRHLAALDLYVAVVPFAATLVLVAVSVGRSRDAVVNEFAALATWTIGGVLAALAAYSSKPLAGAEGYLPSEARLHERNMFIVVPLLLLGLAIWLERGRPGGRRLTVVCVVGAAALPTLLPLGRLLSNANFQNLALIPWGGEGMTSLWPFTYVPLAVVAGLALLGLGRRSGLACWTIVALGFGWTALAAHVSMSTASTNATGTGVGRDPNWVDDALPESSEALVLWVSDGAIRWGGQAIWMNEFFNRQLGHVVEVGTPLPYALPTRTASLVGGVLRDEAGAPVQARYVFAPCWVRVGGELVARDELAEAAVYRVPPGPIRVEPAGSGPGCA